MVRWWQTRWVFYAGYVALLGVVFWLMHLDPAVWTKHAGTWQTVLVVVLFVGVLVAIGAGTFEFSAAMAGAEAALDEERYADSARQFMALAERSVYKPTFAATALLGAGCAHLYNAQHALAIATLHQVNHRLGPGAPRLQRKAALLLVRCYALAGNLAEASRWLDLVCADAREATVADESIRASLWELTGLVLCRQGRFDDACEHYAGAWNTNGLAMPKLERLEASLVFGFALTATGQGHTATFLAGWRESKLGSLTWLTAAWPELAAFVTEQGIDVVN